MIIMKKLCKFMLRLIGLGAIIGGVFAYLKSKGYITVSTNNEDEDYDDFSSVDTEGTERTYINVNTDAMKSKAKEMAQDMKDMAEDAYDGAKEKVKDASKNIAHALEKAWYEAEDTVEDTVEKVEEFFNDED